MADSKGNLKAHDFDLHTTLVSGQVFGWKESEGWYYGEIMGKPTRVRQDGDTLLFEGASKKEIEYYFAIDEDTAAVSKRISRNDPVLSKAVKEFRGLRLLRQDPWICTISFVCSAFSNIPRIEKKLHNLRTKYGRTTELHGYVIHLFPSPQALGAAPISELRACGLGFRDKYVKGLGERMERFDVSKLKKKNYEDAKATLMESAGIGEKVADCICLFSLDKHEAFPIDVWIARVMAKLYGKKIHAMFPKTKFSYRDIQTFARANWGNDAGYAQAFLYMYARKHKLGAERKE
jgi:N-glycosylase/DNA lyase